MKFDEGPRLPFGRVVEDSLCQHVRPSIVLRIFSLGGPDIVNLDMLLEAKTLILFRPSL